MKREDELPGAIRGNKLRKYHTIIPYLLTHRIERLIIIGGPQSNNLLAALQIAREYQFEVTALLLKPWSELNQGNFCNSSLFLKKTDIIWVERHEWSEVESMAEKIAANSNERCFILLEGAAVKPAFAGAMTLGEDIRQNERETGVEFEHIIIDAGTGFSAIALAHWLTQHKHQSQLHVVLMADDEQTFRTKVSGWLGYQAELLCHLPATAKSFGAVNQAVKDEVRRAAIEEGLLLDPIYSAKLFITARQLEKKGQLNGHVLLIHSG